MGALHFATCLANANCSWLMNARWIMLMLLQYLFLFCKVVCGLLFFLVWVRLSEVFYAQTRTQRLAQVSQKLQSHMSQFQWFLPAHSASHLHFDMIRCHDKKFVNLQIFIYFGYWLIIRKLWWFARNKHISKNKLCAIKFTTRAHISLIAVKTVYFLKI